MRAALVGLAALAVACNPTGEIPLAMCPDDGSCFDAVDGAAPDRGFDFGRPPRPRDAAVDAMPDAIADAMPDAITNTMPDAIVDTMPDTMPDAIADATTDAAADAAVPTSCAERALTECFGHPDCPAAERCENIATPALPVPCCVPGPRGELPAGADCSMVDGQIACASGVCIEDGATATCSTPCDDPGDCPAALPRCVAFPFGGTAFEWCFPE